ncbi:MAG: hypothetical protein C0463_02310 [Idiomarina sp.]|nr:hypothetical protein [Idiomarina sp.]
MTQPSTIARSLSKNLIILAAASLSLSACTFQSADSDAYLAQLSCDAGQPWSVDSETAAQKQTAVVGQISAVFRQPQQLGGVFIQSQVRDDAYPMQTQALFIALDDSQLDDAQLGDTIAASGLLSEYQGGWQLSAQHAITCDSASSANALLHYDLELPLASLDSLDNWIHQPVRVNQPLYIVEHFQLARFGQLALAPSLTSSPTQVAMPGDAARDVMAHNALAKIILDDGSLARNPEHVPYPAPGLSMQNPLRRGDKVQPFTGILVKMGDNYHIHPTQTIHIDTHNPRPGADDIDRRGDTRVVAFNVLNYFNGDGQGGDFPTPRGAENMQEFERQEAKLVATMLALDADVFALMEMENDGYGADSAIATLTAALNQAYSQAGKAGEFSFVDPGVERVGGDAITLGYIYRSDTLATVGDAQYSDDPIFAWGSRPPFAQSFRNRNTDGHFTLIANHFKSKGSCPQDDSLNVNQGDGQGCWNALRTESAEQLVSWAESYSYPRILLGDFNAYRMEDPIRAFETAGYTNLAAKFQPHGYSYVFRGDSGSLDHALADSVLLAAVQYTDYWSINADEPVAFEYPLADKSAHQQQAWFAPKPYRSSDHDPIWIDLDSNLLPKGTQ